MIWLICTRTFIYTQCILAKQEHFHCIASLSSSLLRSGYQTPYTSLSFWTHKFRNWRKKLKYQSVESDYTIFSCKFLNTHLTLITCCCSNIDIFFKDLCMPQRTVIHATHNLRTAISFGVYVRWCKIWRMFSVKLIPGIQVMIEFVII